MARESRYDARPELTPREREVLELLRLGLTDAEIGERLGISRPGVSYHVGEIIGKLGVRNRYEAAAWPEPPAWWAKVVAPLALFGRRATGLLPFKASTLATGASGGAFVALVGGMALVATLLMGAGGGAESDLTATEARAARALSSEDEVAPPLPPSSALATTTPGASAGQPVAIGAPGQPPLAEDDSSSDVADAGPQDPDPVATHSESPEAPPNAPPADQTTPTPTPSPAGSGIMVLDCDAAAPGLQTVCQYGASATFAVEVHISQAPQDGYFAFQAKLRWPDPLLEYAPTFDLADEALWQRCDIPARNNNSQPPAAWEASLLYGCVPFPQLAAGSIDTGAVLRFTFRCEDDGVAPLELVPRTGDLQLGTHFLDPLMFPIDPTLAGAQVVCGPCPAGGCPSPQPLPTPHPPTPTPPPTPQPTPTPSGTGAIALDCGAGISSYCGYDSGASFAVRVHVDYAPAGGYFGFQVKLRWDNFPGLDYLPTADPRAEALWSACNIPGRVDNRPNDTSLIFGCAPFPALAQGATMTGPVLEFTFQCLDYGTWMFTLVPRAGDIQLGTHFLDQNLSPIDAELTYTVVNCGG